MTEDAHLVSIVQSLSDIDKDQWDACAKPNGQSYNPFVSYDFLHALEQSGSAVAETGWLGQHMILKDADGQATGVMPCYLKNHSQGEYIFDHGLSLIHI